MQGRNVIQHLLAFLDKKGRSDSLKIIQGRLTIKANAYVLHWFSMSFYFMNAGQDSIYLSLKNCGIFS
jgi:hypothetical protein